MIDVEKLKSYITRHGIKQSYIAKEAALTPDAVSKILAGSRKCEAGEYLRICEALGKSPDEFVKAVTE